MELLFLGTGAGMPAKQRNVSSLALMLLQERNAVWLFDCGEATQHQILHTSLKPGKIEKIFISHLHGDHIYGLPGLIGSRSFQGGTTELTIYGPKGIRDFIEVSLSVSQTRLRYPLTIIEIEEGCIFEDDQFLVETALLDHGIPSFGFRITERDRPGTLDSGRLKAKGIPPGPIYKKLKMGESVQLDHGETVSGLDFLGPDIKGRIITILGDTRPCANALQLAEKADVLVHEATFAAGNEEMAVEYFHSTTTQAANIAKEAGVQELILNHISSRYLKADWDQLVHEARNIFPNTQLSNDFSQMTIAPHKS
ncbi:ribonuclease Z [Lederbergia galactosidilytica]|uniref:Ribonuclease Z n=1 Tax=Lederbergia galactosidilytica TaxID=217031 RepID=A0A178A5G8_9BACI|nr:ribonuclease Z [Lederbergia galactosidilytica]KRG08704.1 ribonuclease Z [Virgibacillus soli]MBP1914712.1 ribonuclease Z [Lederbergia galactosidilytica]OAK75294.1 ribonuclease Z [Lederbergia galactosidilytica]